MKIINRYVLKEHVGPFVFALSALTSLLLLQYIARKFGDLVGRGLSWQVITEFFILSIPFTVAMTLPMAVLVAVLQAFSRLASENEITALKAGGISMRALMRPALTASVFLALFMLWFNDQLLPQANHRLQTLQVAIFRTKPTFALKPQVINTVKEGQLYLRAGNIAEDESGRLRDVTIYDVGDALHRRTIYADSGVLSFAANRKDLAMHLFSGVVLSAPTKQSGQFNRIYFQQNELRVRDVANQFQSIDADTAAKGDREMSVCEMQSELEHADARVQRALADSLMMVWRASERPGHHTPQPRDVQPKKAGGIGAVYCAFVKKYLHIPEARAAELPTAGTRLLLRQDTTAKKTGTTPVPAVTPTVTTPAPEAAASARADMYEVNLRLEAARHARNRFGVEIQKKFSLAACCIVFVLVGAPIALRFPRGGVGLVMGVSFLVFAIYYIGLIGGESLSNNNVITPFWAMWSANLIFLVVGIYLMSRMGREGVTMRGGNMGERIDATRAWFARQARRAGINRSAESTV